LDFERLLAGDTTAQERDDLNLAALLSRAPLLSDQTYWSQVMHVFRCMAAPIRRLDVWRAVFLSERPGRGAMISPPDRKLLEAMPAVLTVYRGVQNTDHAAGLNWTLHRPIAEHYATATRDWSASDADAPLVVTGRLPRDAVLMYFATDHYSQTFGNERESVALPEAVEVVGIEKL
jgi:hypothetical protein